MHVIIPNRRTLLALAAALVLAVPAVAVPANGPVADVLLGITQVQWVPSQDFAGLQLTISGPAGVVQRSFAPGDTVAFELAEMTGEVDGTYNWELTAAPRLDSNAQAVIAAARAAGDAGGERVRPDSLPPRSELIQGGFFTVQGGAIIQPATEDATPPSLRVQGTGDGAQSASGEVNYVTAADQVILDDLIVDGSACIGMDCINGENFGFDTIRLKENNLRIKFEDTSNSAGFPSTDWQLVANDSASGGLNHFSIEDVTGGRVPFKVEGGSPTSSIYVDSTGNVGFGTNAPVVQVHVKDGNTPTLRLEQDVSSGFSAQVWDVAGNEANFFVRDTTGGSKLPFRIQPGAPQNSLFIAANGDVGMGTQSPSAAMHVVGDALIADTSAVLTVQNTDTTPGARELAVFENHGTVTFKFVESSNAANNWLNGLRSNNKYIITTEGSIGAPLFELDSLGNLVTAGTVNGSSSRALKEDFEPVDQKEILARLLKLPIQEWQYTRDEAQRRHLGPFSEDFAAAFGLNGDDDRHISYTDMDGVAFAAIQGLHQVVEEKDGRIQTLEQQNRELAERLQILEQAIQSSSDAGR